QRDVPGEDAELAVEARRLDEVRLLAEHAALGGDHLDVELRHQPPLCCCGCSSPLPGSASSAGRSPLPCSASSAGRSPLPCSASSAGRSPLPCSASSAGRSPLPCSASALGWAP